MYPEKLLHLCWSQRYIPSMDWMSTEQQSIQLLRLGTLNQGQGPDFLNAEIFYQNLLWHGAVEMHLETEDWYRHKHEQDAYYNQVILHVVAKSSGKAVYRADGIKIPEIEIGDKIPANLLNGWKKLAFSPSEIPCAPLHLEVNDLQKTMLLGRMGIERLEEKAALYKKIWEKAQGDWQQLVWFGLLEYLGGNTNKAVFHWIGEHLSWKVLQKYKEKSESLEAMLLGVAGLLDVEEQDVYAHSLQNEWEWMRHAYNLPSNAELPILYHGMRPQGFADTRLAQAAALFQYFSAPADLLMPQQAKNFLTEKIEASDYWKKHYRIGIESPKGSPVMSKEVKEGILLNVIAPIGHLYRMQQGWENDTWLSDIAEMCSPENNQITRIWKSLHWEAKNGLETQGQLHLYKQYCKQSRCLECSIGQQLLRKPIDSNATTTTDPKKPPRPSQYNY